jgi:hypothetical protein
MRQVFLAALVIGCGIGCGGGKGNPDAPIDGPNPDARLIGFDQPELVCPGDPGCESAGDGVLHVGGGKRSFTPEITETWTDLDDDDAYDAGEPFVDANGNGEFDPLWLYGGNNPATGVLDDLEARAIAFRQGDTTVVILYLDEIGILLPDMERIRAAPGVAALAIDHIVIGATHLHSSPDTVGIWGATPVSSGRNDEFIATMIDAAAQAIEDAIADLEPASLQIASTLLINDPANPASLTDRWNKDIRDPIIFDPTLTIARFVRAGAPTETIATLVNWANHPELAYFDGGPKVISADYPHWLRDKLETGVLASEVDGLVADLAGLGGITVFVQGALGGQIGSLRGTAPLDPDGEPLTTGPSHVMAQVLGTNAAARALIALSATGEDVTELPLSMRTATYAAQIKNIGFQTAFLIGILEHPTVGYDPDDDLDDDNTPWLPLRATYVQVGPLGIATCPGELHPELWVGGYDGDWSWGWPIVDARKPNTADLTAAPAPPYLRDLVLANPGVEYPILAGVAEDYVGYIVPAYNYVLHPTNPYLDEADGDHYEEVYSLGPEVEHHVVHPILDLVAYRRP